MQTAVLACSIIAAAAPASTTAAPPVPPASLVPADEAVRERADTFLRASHEAGLFSGTALLARGDRVVFAAGVGHADVETKRPNEIDTVYKTCSVGKQFFAATALRLVERGLLRLDEPIATYLPEYPRPQGDQITVRMLMNHTSGIPNYTRLPIYRDAMTEAVEPAEFYKAFSGLPLDFEPGGGWSYSNSGYYVLGVILERVSAMPIDELLDREIFQPLGLTQTGYDDDPASPAGRATGWEWGPGGFVPERPVHHSKIFAAGMLYSTAEDLFRWTRALHAGDVFQDPATRRFMTEPSEGNTEEYVLGIGIREIEREGQTFRVAGHGGGLHGFQTLLAYLMPGEWTVVLLSNAGDDLDALTAGFETIVAGGTPATPKPPLMVAMAESIERSGLEVTRAWLREVRDEGFDAFDTSEAAINSLGYYYLARGEYAAAILVLQTNVDLFPESSNVYDSLGEAYLASGEEQLALVNYRRAFAMDPENTNAKSVVERLEAGISGRDSAR